MCVCVCVCVCVRVGLRMGLREFEGLSLRLINFNIGVLEAISICRSIDNIHVSYIPLSFSFMLYLPFCVI